MFVLQIAGEKQWFIHEPVFESPLRSQPWNDRAQPLPKRPPRAPVIDTVLRPGDALYLPRGYLHSAKALGGVSVHLTVGIQPGHPLRAGGGAPRARRWDLSLRTSLPASTYPTPRQCRPDLEATVSALQRWLDDARTEDVAARVRRRTWGATRPAPVSPLAQAAALRALDASLHLRPHLRVAIDAVGDDLRLSFADRNLTLPVVYPTRPRRRAVRSRARRWLVARP